MLIQFNFENYKTYLNETSLNLMATSIQELQSNLISDKYGGQCVKVLAIYGANASGKSNLLLAFSHMRKLVLKSFEQANTRRSIPQKPFQFCEEGKYGKSTFEVFFLIDEIEYQYGYIADDKLIHEEWLYKKARDCSEYKDIFERKFQEINLLEPDLEKLNETLSLINEQTLVLSVLSKFKVEDAINVTRWFEDTRVINFGDVIFEVLISRSLPKVNFEDKREKERFINYLKAIDVGIENIRIEKVSEPKEYDEEEEGTARYKYNVFSQHKNYDTNEVEEIPLTDESSGTVKMISLYYFVYDAIKKGSTLFVDEMDAKLHPLLTRYIINLFQNSEVNTNNAQLIFTTHDTNALSKDLLRKDQIWFVEKNQFGVSELYSLVEFDFQNEMRESTSYVKDYLGGRYGAIPNLKDFKVGE